MIRSHCALVSQTPCHALLNLLGSDDNSTVFEENVALYILICWLLLRDNGQAERFERGITADPAFELVVSVLEWLQ